MIKVTLKKTDELFTLVDSERDSENNIVVSGETWTEIVDKVNALKVLGAGETTEEALVEMTNRYESIFEVNLLLDNGDDFDKRAASFFRALAFRGTVYVEESR